MKKNSLFLLGLIALISQDVFCQEDSVVLTKFNEHYVEIQSLRFKLDSGYSVSIIHKTPGAYPDGVYTRIDYRPKPIVLKDGIVLIKDRNQKPIQLLFYDDSVLVQNNYFKSNGKLDYQEFGHGMIGDSLNNDCYVVLFWTKEMDLDGIRYFFNKKKMIIQYNSSNRKPSITFEPQ